MNAEWVTACAESVIAVTAVFGVFLGNRQLKDIAASQKLNGLNTILEIENQVNGRKQTFDQCSADVKMAKLNQEPEATQKIRAQLFNSAKENYFNAVDRLSFCIKKGYVPERDWVAEYRNYLLKILQEFPDDFRAGSPYTNIIDLNNKWQRD